MSTIKLPFRFFIFSLLLLLSACGGSGSGGDALPANSPNSNPVVTSAIPDLAATEDAEFNYTLPAKTFTDPDGDPLTYTASQGNGEPLPDWLGFDAGSRHFTGTPGNSDVGSLIVRLTVFDGRGGSAADTFLLTVINTNDPPVISKAIADQIAYSDNAFSLVIPADTFTDEDMGDTLTLAAVESGSSRLPAWLTFDPQSATLYGIPSVNDTGKLSVDIIATDSSGASVTDSFIISVVKSVSLSGTISVSSATGVDSDTNNADATNKSNNSPSEAQIISAPIRIGGFLTLDATNTQGDKFQNSTDVNDYYRVDLRAGDIVNLYIADHPGGTSSTADLELELIDASSESVIADSLGQTATETVTVPASPGDGNYYIRVFAYGTGSRSNYLLTVGQESKPANISPLSSFDDFVAGEIITISKPAPDTAINALGITTKYQKGNRAKLIQVPLDTVSILAVQNRGVGTAYSDQTGIAPARLKRLKTIWSMKRLRSEKDSAILGLNYRRKPVLIPDDSYYSFQWNYPLMNLPQAWDLTTGDSNVIVAVVDTGVVLDHPDLAGKLITGYDFISDPTNALDGDGIDANPDDPGDQSSGAGSSWHGTHVTGTIAAATSNNTGVAGVGWKTRVMPLRALGSLGGTSYDIIQSIRYAAGLSNDSNTVPAKAADIINLSLGGPGFSAAEQAEYTNVRNAGVIIVAASGNDNDSKPFYPSSYDGVVSVSAVDLEKNRAYYSNFGSTIDIAAPGGDIRVNINGDDYADGILSTLVENDGSRTPNYVFYQGTSMAAAHVSGVVALMKAVYPGLTPAELDELISTGAITEDLAGNGIAVRDDLFGYGLIDAFAAVSQANTLAGGGELPPVIEVVPSSIDFGSRSSQTLSITNGGGGTLKITRISKDQAWISVFTSSVDANGLGTYTVLVDRAGLPSGTYTGSLSIESDSAGTVRVNLSMQVSPPKPAPVISYGDAGLQYVLLLDTETRKIVAQDIVSVSNGSYQYTLNDVAPGRYYLTVGSDMDNDGYICDLGESCGNYPTSNLPTAVIVGSKNISGLNFTTDFPVLISPASVSINGANVGNGIGRPGASEELTR